MNKKKKGKKLSMSYYPHSQYLFEWSSHKGLAIVEISYLNICVPHTDHIDFEKRTLIFFFFTLLLIRNCKKKIGNIL